MPINIPFQNDTKTSLYIVNLSKASGKTYRELKSLWDKYNREVQYDVMYNPTKYVNFGKNDLYTEVGRRLEEYLNNPTGEIKQEVEQADTAQAEQSFGNDVEQNLEQPQEQPLDQSTEPTSTDIIEEPSTETPPEQIDEGTTPEGTQPEEITMTSDESDQMPSDDEIDAIFSDLGM